MTVRLALKASGMVTSVGFSSRASCAAIRAGVRRVVQTNLWDRGSGTYLPAGKVDLPHWWIGVGKLAGLVAPAIRECLVAAQPLRAEEIPILLGLSSPQRPFRFTNLDGRILEEIEYRLGYQLHPNSRIIARGQVSVLLGLQEAERLIDAGTASRCVVAAVDSMVQQDLVEYHLEKRRLLTPKNSNGFCVGEAGSAVLVAPVNDVRAGDLQILGSGHAHEPATIESEEPLRGEGLATAIGEALRASTLEIEEIHYRIADLNGEHYKFKEMVFAVMRYSRRKRPENYDLFDLWHPIEYVGDVGAAIGPIVLGVALQASQKGYAVGPTILCTFSSDDGGRAAIILGSSSGGNSA